ncbi:hypothetical protein HXX76_015336 [Chlamydomonas incerta]|uniref:Uncharacterized protein n=1 Tax=Chlamydomonas incerta TaxID=51695 RepID=A0A835SDE1_CHLIN|nr:hypothetical protein HXX76_015336 [Chlamydomonas incerta]|eukprot:KAG2423466.1 hypothetical protein HXX76_015336 [Chlamydomonas incerta]
MDAFNTAATTNIAAGTNTAAGTNSKSNPGKGGGAKPRPGQAAVTLMLAAAAQRNAAASTTSNPTANAKGAAPVTIQVDYHLVACQVYDLARKFAAGGAARKQRAGGSGSASARGGGGVVEGCGGDSQMQEQQASVTVAAAVSPAALESEPPQPPPAAAVTQVLAAKTTTASVSAVVASETAKQPPPPPSPQPPELLSQGPAAIPAPAPASAIGVDSTPASSVAAFRPEPAPAPSATLCSLQTQPGVATYAAVVPARHPLQPGPVPAPAALLPPALLPGAATAATTTAPAAPAFCPPVAAGSALACTHGGAHQFAPVLLVMPEGGCSGFFTTQTQLPTITTAVTTAFANSGSADANVPFGAAAGFNQIGAAPPAATAAASGRTSGGGGANTAMVNALCYSPVPLPPTITTATLDAGRSRLPGLDAAPAALGARASLGGGVNAAATCATRPADTTPGDPPADSHLDACAAFGPACAGAGAGATHLGGGDGGGDVPMQDCWQLQSAPDGDMRLIHDSFSGHVSPHDADADVDAAMTEAGVDADAGADADADADAFARGAWSDCDELSLSGGIFAGGDGTGGGSAVSPELLAQVPSHLLPPSGVEMVIAAPVGQQVVGAAAGAGVGAAAAAVAAAAVSGNDSPLCHATLTLKPPQHEPQPKREQRQQQRLKVPQSEVAQLEQQQRRNSGCLAVERQQHLMGLHNTQEHLARVPMTANGLGPAAAAAVGDATNTQLHTLGADMNVADIAMGTSCGAQVYDNEHDALWQDLCSPLGKSDYDWYSSLLSDDDGSVV